MKFSVDSVTMATTYSHVLWEEKKVFELSSVTLLVRLWVIVTKGGCEGGGGEREREEGRGKRGEGGGRVRREGGGGRIRREEERGKRGEGGGRVRREVGWEKGVGG